MTDQHTAKALSCRGWPGVSTPNLDRLAADGVLFERSFCPAPVCGPARASWITGHYPSTHKLMYNHDARYVDDDADRLPTFADGLRQIGYTPYWIGKWHASEFYPEEEKTMHGFRFLPIHSDGNRAYGAEVDDAATDRAVAFLETPPEDPFFLGVSLHNPHDICMWIGEQGDPVLNNITEQGDLPPLPANHEIQDDEPDYFQTARRRPHYGAEVQATHDWTPDSWRKYLRAYNRLLEHADRNLGRVLEALDASGLRDDTLVLFTSDHGEGCAAHKLVVKLSLYDESAGVPLIARWPGEIPAGRICVGHTANGVDLAPTFLEAAGAPPLPGLPGQSLLPWMRDPERPGREHTLVQLHPDPKRPEVEGRLLRSRKFAYMVYSIGRQREALYDPVQDPGQTRNLARDPDSRDLLSEARSEMDRELRRIGDPFHKSAIPV